MKGDFIHASETARWRNWLSRFCRVDVCQMPEYHVAYATRTKNSKPAMWTFEDGGDAFGYPFLLTPVEIGIEDTGYKDISSIYGYSGPLSTTQDPSFLRVAWDAFDAWAMGENIIADFTRYSVYAETHLYAHPETEILDNRVVAVSDLPNDVEQMMAVLPSKTRNMIRKARSLEMEARELDLECGIPLFRALYSETMDRNHSPDFFIYDDFYYDTLMTLPKGEFRLFGVFSEDRLVSTAIALVHAKSALYHLGASLHEFARQGAGNLALFEMSCHLAASGVDFLMVGGGRTTAEDDALFRFKKSNATHTSPYYIGKRKINPEGYKAVENIWKNKYKDDAKKSRLIFYRD